MTISGETPFCACVVKVNLNILWWLIDFVLNLLIQILSNPDVYTKGYTAGVGDAQGGSPRWPCVHEGTQCPVRPRGIGHGAHYRWGQVFVPNGHCNRFSSLSNLILSLCCLTVNC